MVLKMFVRYLGSYESSQNSKSRKVNFDFCYTDQNQEIKEHLRAFSEATPTGTFNMQIRKDRADELDKDLEAGLSFYSLVLRTTVENLPAYPILTPELEPTPKPKPKVKKKRTTTRKKKSTTSTPTTRKK